jgi:hypothetical protein
MSTDINEDIFVARVNASDTNRWTAVLELIEKFEKHMHAFDAEIKTRAVKEVLEDDRKSVGVLTYRFLVLMHECRASALDGGMIGALEKHGIVIFKGPAFDGLECKIGDVLLKVHLFPPDSDETLWHNHGQNFFSCAIGRSGKYWHRFGELQQDGNKSTYVFEKQGEGDPCFQSEAPGSIKTMIAHVHQAGSMYFIHAQAKHTVQAERGTGPVLTCVVQAGQKTNSTSIFKADQDPIQGNFRPRDKNLTLENKIEILRAICAEVAGVEIQSQLKLTPLLKSESFQEVESPPRPASDALRTSTENGFVVAKNASSRPPNSVEVRCVLCHCVFANRNKLREHECNFHGQTDFQCFGCNKSFKSSEDVRRHSRSTSHAISRIFQLGGHVLEGSESSDCSVSTAGSRGEKVTVDCKVAGFCLVPILT